MKTLPAAITTMKVGDSDRVILFRIIPEAGDAWSELLWATKDITVTAWAGGGTSKVFVGNVLADQELGSIRQSIDIEEGGNVATVSGLTFRVLNPQYISSARFDQFVSDEPVNLENRICEIYLASWTGSNPAWSSILLLHTFIIDDVSYDYGEYEIKLRDAGLKRHKNIPDLLLTVYNYPQVPDSNQDKCVPLVFGDLGTVDPALNKLNVTPAFRTSKVEPDFIISRNQIISITEVYVFISDGKRIARFFKASPFTVSYGRPTTIALPGWQSLMADLYSQGEKRGIRTDPSDMDIKNAVDDTEATYLTLTANQKLYVSCPVPNGLGYFENGMTLFYLVVVAGAITGTVRLRYYNMEFDAGEGLFSNGEEFDSGDQNTYLTHNFGADKSAHGTADDQSDMNSNWTPDELNDYEFGLQCNAGSSIQIKNIYIYLYHIWCGSPPLTAKNLLQSSDEAFVVVSGPVYGSAIGGRSNGRSSTVLAECAPYIVELILRSELGLTDTEINIASFDTAGNTTNGDRKDWKAAEVISDQGDSRDIIEKFCKEFGVVYFQNYENKETVRALKKLTAVKTIDRTTIQEETPKITFSKYKNIYNEFYLNYRKQYPSGKFLKTLFITASDHNLVSNTRGGTPNTYTGLCADSQTKYNFTQRLTLDCDWIRDNATAEYLIKWLAEWLCYRKYIVEFQSAGLDHIELELGDQIKIDHTLLPTGVSNDDSFIIFDIAHDLDDDKITYKCMQVPDLLP